MPLLFLGSTSLMAAPYYVGDNPTPQREGIVELGNFPTRSDIISNKLSIGSGNIVGLELSGNYELEKRLSLGGSLPFYFLSQGVSNKGLTGNFGNMRLGAIFNDSLSESTDQIRYGWYSSMDAYLPTSRDIESVNMALADPAHRHHEYMPSTFTAAPTAGIFVSQNRWSAKTNFQYAYHFTSKDSFVGAGDNHNHSLGYQVGATYHPLENLNLNLEYNSLWKVDPIINTRSDFNQSIVPSVSGKVQDFVGNIYLSIPFDEQTVNITPLAVGTKVAYQF